MADTATPPQPTTVNETVTINVKSWKDNAGVLIAIGTIIVGGIVTFTRNESTAAQNAKDLSEFKTSTNEQFKNIRSDLAATNNHLDGLSKDMSDVKVAVGRIEGAVGSK